MSNLEFKHSTSDPLRPNIFVQNRELFIPRSAATISTRGIAEYYNSRIMGDTGDLVPSSGEFEYSFGVSQQIFNILHDNKFVWLSGDHDTGKSSALYGLRQILFDQGTSYIAINGHYLDRPKRIANIIRWASRSGSTVLYDSFDYNFKRPSKTNKSKHNREQVLPSLREHLSGGNKLVVTSHGQDWFDRMSNSSLTEEFVSFIDELEATSLELFDKH